MDPHTIPARCPACVAGLAAICVLLACTTHAAYAMPECSEIRLYVTSVGASVESICYEPESYGLVIHLSSVGDDAVVKMGIPYFYIPRAVAPGGDHIYYAGTAPETAGLPVSVEYGEDCQTFTVMPPPGTEEVRMLRYAEAGTGPVPGILVGCDAAGQRIPAPLHQVLGGADPESVQCGPDKFLMQSARTTPACVSESSMEKLIERGWTAVAPREAAPHAVPAGSGSCVNRNIIAGKIDPGLLDQIRSLMDANVTRTYSVLLFTAESHKSTVTEILTECHGATDIVPGKALSFVTARVPLGEIPYLSAHGEIRAIGAGELFEVPASLPEMDGMTWVQIDPVQCNENPWEQDLSGLDNIPPGSDMEFELVKGYYGEHGVAVSEIKRATTHGLVCQACSCPAGHTLYLLIPDESVERMTGLGFEISRTG